MQTGVPVFLSRRGEKKSGRKGELSPPPPYEEENERQKKLQRSFDIYLSKGKKPGGKRRKRGNPASHLLLWPREGTHVFNFIFVLYRMGRKQEGRGGEKSLLHWHG